MVIREILVSLIIAVLMTGLYLLVTRRAERRTGLIWLFLLIFLVTWAGGAWLRPMGPALLGIHCLSFLMVGALFALLLFIIIPRRTPRGRQETLDMLESMEREKELEAVAYITLGIFFWILLVLLAASILGVWGIFSVRTMPLDAIPDLCRRRMKRE